MSLSPAVLAANEAIRKAHKQGRWDEEAQKVLNTEWQTILDRYPLLFQGPNIGLGCGSGWWVALEDCFNEITGILNTYPGLKFNAVQIKEKFGGLRFYYDLMGRETLNDDQRAAAGEAINDAIEAAERKAAVACEVCGEPGERRDGNWIRTLCDAHADKQKR